MGLFPASGKVDVPIIYANIASGIDVYRQGKLCILYISNANLNLTTSWDDIGTIPAGYKCNASIYVDGISDASVGYKVYANAYTLQAKRNSTGSGTVKVNCIITYFAAD